MARTRWFWIGSCLLLMIIATGNSAMMLWRWGRPYMLGDPLAGFPRVFLWVWERPEDLEFIDPREVGVAVLARTLIVQGAHISARPRMQPIKLPPGVTSFAVVRIETGAEPPADPVRKEALQQILASVPAFAVGLQLDFDARASERTWYRDLLVELRSQLPPGMKLSITALASWCVYDDWISSLPVDESVPMFFRLGVDEETINRYLAAGRDFRAAKTRFSMGLSMDELPMKAPGGRRVYVFNPLPWTRDSVNEALRYVRERR
jgi:hypothetical protein